VVEKTFASTRPFIFHPLIVLFLSLVSAALYALYVTLRFSGGNLWSQYYYVTPIIVPFVAFLFDRAGRFRQLTALQLVTDASVVFTALWRVIGHVPYISGHALFLTYALFSTRSRVAQVTAAIVMLQVIYLKYLVWHDWVTSTCGIALGVLAALVARWFGSRSRIEPLIAKATI
jgi:hypothetical protein